MSVDREKQQAWSPALVWIPLHSFSLFTVFSLSLTSAEIINYAHVLKAGLQLSNCGVRCRGDYQVIGESTALLGSVWLKQGFV